MVFQKNTFPLPITNPIAVFNIFTSYSGMFPFSFALQNIQGKELGLLDPLPQICFLPIGDSPQVSVCTLLGELSQESLLLPSYKPPGTHCPLKPYSLASKVTQSHSLGSHEKAAEGHVCTFSCQLIFFCYFLSLFNFSLTLWFAFYFSH